jgi:hypothetical protein
MLGFFGGSDLGDFVTTHFDQPAEGFPAVVLVFDKENIHHGVLASVRLFVCLPKFVQPPNHGFDSSKQQISCQISPSADCRSAFYAPNFPDVVAPLGPPR